MGCGDADIALAWISPPGYKNPDTTDAVPVQLGGGDKGMEHFSCHFSIKKGLQSRSPFLIRIHRTRSRRNSRNNFSSSLSLPSLSRYGANCLRSKEIFFGGAASRLYAASLASSHASKISCFSAVGGGQRRTICWTAAWLTWYPSILHISTNAI